MQYGMCCPCMACEKFPAGLNSSESEEASRKRGLGRELHLSTTRNDPRSRDRIFKVITLKILTKSIITKSAL